MNHKPCERPGYYMVWCYEYCWAWRVAVVDDFGNLVRVHTGRAHHSVTT